MTDRYQHHRPGLHSPAEGGAAITPADGSDLPAVTRAIYVGSSGTLRVVLLSGEEVTFTGVIAGMIYPLRLRRVLATGTTAGGLVGLR